VVLLAGLAVPVATAGIRAFTGFVDLFGHFWLLCGDLEHKLFDEKTPLLYYNLFCYTLEIPGGSLWNILLRRK
jgi:hypothetical protein